LEHLETIRKFYFDSPLLKTSFEVNFETAK
jgi:hypothetical protein